MSECYGRMEQPKWEAAEASADAAIAADPVRTPPTAFRSLRMCVIAAAHPESQPKTFSGGYIRRAASRAQMKQEVAAEADLYKALALEPQAALPVSSVTLGVPPPFAKEIATSPSKKDKKKKAPKNSRAAIEEQVLYIHTYIRASLPLL